MQQEVISRTFNSIMGSFRIFPSIRLGVLFRRRISVQRTCPSRITDRVAPTVPVARNARASSFRNARLAGIKAKLATFRDADLTDADLSGGDFTRADFRRTHAGVKGGH